MRACSVLRTRAPLYPLCVHVLPPPPYVCILHAAHAHSPLCVQCACSVLRLPASPKPVFLNTPTTQSLALNCPLAFPGPTQKVFHSMPLPCPCLNACVGGHSPLRMHAPCSACPLPPMHARSKLRMPAPRPTPPYVCTLHVVHDHPPVHSCYMLHLPFTPLCVHGPCCACPLPPMHDVLMCMSMPSPPYVCTLRAAHVRFPMLRMPAPPYAHMPAPLYACIFPPAPYACILHAGHVCCHLHMLSICVHARSPPMPVCPRHAPYASPLCMHDACSMQHLPTPMMLG